MVTLSDGGTFLGSATLGAGGTASVTWTPPTAGVLTLTASYAGDRRFDPTSSAHVVTVERSAAAIGFSSGPLKPGRKGTLKVSVATVAGVPATGRITVRVVGRKLTATLKNGVASFRVPKLPRSGTLKVNAAYSGDGEYAAGSGKHSFQLKK
jgi:hypothetical protein